MRVFVKSLLAVVVAALFLTSCGGGSEVCNCASIGLAMMKEVKAMGVSADEAKQKALQEKYKAKMEKCEKLDEGKSDEEKKKMEEEMKACPAFKEMEAVQKEIMEMMKQGSEEHATPKDEEPTEEPKEEGTTEEGKTEEKGENQ